MRIVSYIIISAVFCLLGSDLGIAFAKNDGKKKKDICTKALVFLLGIAAGGLWNYL